MLSFNSCENLHDDYVYHKILKSREWNEINQLIFFYWSLKDHINPMELALDKTFTQNQYYLWTVIVIKIGAIIFKRSEKTKAILQTAQSTEHSNCVFPFLKQHEK